MDPIEDCWLHGGIQKTSLFANLACYIPLAHCVSLTLGAGAGATSMNASVRTRLPTIYVASGTKAPFARQGIVGFVFPVSNNFELRADYCCQGIGDTSHNSTFFAPANVRFKNESNQAIMLSFH